MRRRVPRLLVVLALSLPLAAPAHAAPAETKTVTVFAAASLSESFEALGKLFRAKMPGRDVRFVFAGSQQLAMQIDAGAACDVFASADARWMQDVASRSALAAPAVPFARNRMAVIIPATDPGRVGGLPGLARSGLKVVMCELTVPAGFYARKLLANLAAQPGYPPDYAQRVMDNVVSQEDNVKGVVGKVRLGEADAGFVYLTDVTGPLKKSVRALPLPQGCDVISTYPVATLTRAADPEGAKAFVELLLSKEGQAVLARAGFLPPEPVAK